MKKIAIIGGGASGLFCAITAKEKNKNLKVIVFEKMERVGKKLLATGNGRCNITNENVLETKSDRLVHYHGYNPSFANNALSSFDDKMLIKYFQKNGLIFRKEQDKFYPFSEQAGTILDFLRMKCDILGISIKTGANVSKINKNKNGYTVNDDCFDCVIIASGGKSSSHFGSDGSGYALLESFGHKCTSLYPAITQIKTETMYVKQLKGIKADALCSAYINSNLVRREFGQVLFADYGLSGPPVFQLSGIFSKNSNKKCEIILDFMKDYSPDEIEQLIFIVIKNNFNITCENLLGFLLNKRLGQVIIKSCGIKLSVYAKSLSKSDISLICEKIKCFKLNVLGVKGFANAQVTAGGISTEQFDSTTLQSKLSEGLYACGEVLDIYGDCGGYNLQWAFSSAYAVGTAVSKL